MGNPQVQDRIQNRVLDITKPPFAFYHYIKKNIKITFNRKNYTIKTNSKGIAAFKIPKNIKVIGNSAFSCNFENADVFGLVDLNVTYEDPNNLPQLGENAFNNEFEFCAE